MVMADQIKPTAKSTRKLNNKNQTKISQSDITWQNLGENKRRNPEVFRQSKIKE